MILIRLHVIWKRYHTRMNPFWQIPPYSLSLSRSLQQIFIHQITHPAIIHTLVVYQPSQPTSQSTFFHDLTSQNPPPFFLFFCPAFHYFISYTVKRISRTLHGDSRKGVKHTKCRDWLVAWFVPLKWSLTVADSIRDPKMERERR